MNSYDAKAGVKLGFTAAGTLIGGPVGGAIGSAIGTLAGTLIPTKTFINQKTSFNENVDQNMSYSRADYGKGFVNYTSQDREKATTFSKIADTAADVIPMVAGATGFKGVSKFPSLFGSKDVVAKADEVIKTGNEVTSGVGNVVKSNTMKKVFDYGTKGIGTINDMIEIFGNQNDQTDIDVEQPDIDFRTNSRLFENKNNSDDNPLIENKKTDILIKSNFDAIDFDSSVNNIMKSIGDSPYKPIESYKETFSTPRNRFVPSSAVNDYLPSVKNSTFNYISDTPKTEPLKIENPLIESNHSLQRMNMREYSSMYPKIKGRSTPANYALEAIENAKTKEQMDNVFNKYKQQYPFEIPNINPAEQKYKPADLKNFDFNKDYDKELEEYKKRNKNAKYYMSY